MKPRLTSAAEPTPVRVVIISLAGHISGAVDRAREELEAEIPGLELSFHAATSWDDDPEALEACRADIAAGDIIFANMLFMEDHIRAVLPALTARRAHCDAMVCCISSGAWVMARSIAPRTSSPDWVFGMTGRVEEFPPGTNVRSAQSP